MMRIRQLNLDCYGCRGPLDRPEELLTIMEEAALAAGAKVLGRSIQRYPVYGLTAVVFLAESHLLVSTYPEHGYSVVEVFMCNTAQDPYLCSAKIVDYLLPTSIRPSEMFHHVGKHPGRESHPRGKTSLESLVKAKLSKK